MWKCETFTAESAGAACSVLFLLVVLCYSLIGCGVEKKKRKFAILRKQLVGCSGACFVSVALWESNFFLTLGWLCYVSFCPKPCFQVLFGRFLLFPETYVCENMMN